MTYKPSSTAPGYVAPPVTAADPYVGSKVLMRASVPQVAPIGKIWTQSTLPVNTNWYGMVYGGGKFVAVPGPTSKAVYSTDGIIWTQSNDMPSTGWRSVAYGNGRFVAVAAGSTTAAYSSDGITWTLSNPLPFSSSWFSVTYGNGTFVAVTNTASKKAAYSTDGITWFQSNDLPAIASWYAVTYGNGKFVAVANGDIAGISSDGITWTASQSISGTSNNWYAITYGNNKFVAVSYNYANSATSPDGINWTAGVLPLTSQWYSVAYGDGVFVATSQTSGTIAATSTDGITWTRQSMPAVAGWQPVAYGANKFVALPSSGTIGAYSAAVGPPITSTIAADTVIDSIVITTKSPVPVQIQLDGADLYNGTVSGIVNLNTNIKTTLGKVLTAGATYPGATVHVSGVEIA